jgi:hypothetical protein
MPVSPPGRRAGRPYTLALAVWPGGRGPRAALAQSRSRRRRLSAAGGAAPAPRGRAWARARLLPAARTPPADRRGRQPGQGATVGLLLRRAAVSLPRHCGRLRPVDTRGRRRPVRHRVPAHWRPAAAAAAAATMQSRPPDLEPPRHRPAASGPARAADRDWTAQALSPPGRRRPGRRGGSRAGPGSESVRISSAGYSLEHTGTHRDRLQDLGPTGSHNLLIKNGDSDAGEPPARPSRPLGDC